LTEKLFTEAVRRGLHEPGAEIDLAAAYSLVRDMPYQRASDRQPETLIREWRGTCSGKHYLLKALFAELGCRSQVIACTSVEPITEDKVPLALHDLWLAAGKRFVDVHNYLVLELPEGEMVVDATWPLSARKYGLKVNERFVRGQDQEIASTPIRKWVIPRDEDPQAFKDRLLEEYFIPEELAFREAFILALGEWMAGEKLGG
jgi:hypothetical protein